MASDTFLSANAMQGIINQMIVGAHINASGRLIVETVDGTEIDAGYVKGSSTPEAIDPTAGTLMRRDAFGRSRVAGPTANLDVVNKAYADQLKLQADANDVQVLNDAAQYTDDTFGALPPVSIFPDPDTLVVRGVTGRIAVAEPVNENNAATKKYVDDQIRFLPDNTPSTEDPPDFATGVSYYWINTATGYPTTYGLVKVTKATDVRIVQEYWSKTQAGYWVRTSNASGGGWGPWMLGGLPDSGWERVSFRSGYESFSSSYPVDVRRIGNVVYMRGLVKPVSGKFSSGSTYTVFDLPGEEYEPEDVHWAAGAVTNNDGGALIRVTSGGNTDLRIGTTDTDWVGLGTSWVARELLKD